MTFLLGMNPRICALEGACGFKVAENSTTTCRAWSNEKIIRAQQVGKCNCIPIAKKVEEKKRVGQQKQKKS